MDYGKEALRIHKQYQGKIEVSIKVPLESVDDLSTIYTPGVAKPCLEIRKDKKMHIHIPQKGIRWQW